MVDVQIRAPEPTDAEDLAALFNCPGVVAGTLQLPWRSRQLWQERLAQRTVGQHALVAVAEGHVVGWLSLQVEQSPRRRHCGNIGMAVHDAYQGRGIGSALMAAIIDLAENWLGLRRIELTVWSDNQPAIRLYEKFKFVLEGTAREHGFRNGEYINAQYMARLRAP